MAGKGYGADVYRWGELSRDLEGFAAATTGGVGGVRFVVTSGEDYLQGERPLAGTLRYAIEQSDPDKPLWVTFSLKGGVVVLKRTLKLRSDLTIDGRGEGRITIANQVDWSLYTLDESKKTGRQQCARRDNSIPFTTLFLINRKNNIIITHLDFRRFGVNESPWEKSIPNLDKECLGDIVSIYNDGTNSGRSVDNIWINRSSFQDCGDGCIDITRPAGTVGNISISWNRFFHTDKTMIIGTGYNAYAKLDPMSRRLERNVPRGEYPYRVSIYGNDFSSVNERNPRASSALVHVYRNRFENWGLYLVYAENSIVLYEQNVVLGADTSQVISPHGRDAVWIYGNVDQHGGAVTGLEDTPGYQKQKAIWIN